MLKDDNMEGNEGDVPVHVLGELESIFDNKNKFLDAEYTGPEKIESECAYRWIRMATAITPGGGKNGVNWASTLR